MNRKPTEIFRPFGEDGPAIPVSTLENPAWHHDGAELGLAIWGKTDESQAPRAIIWISIEERNHYCDRGHFLVKILAGDAQLCLDSADFRPNYYMKLQVAKDETIQWLRWRLLKERQERYGKIREIDRRVEMSLNLPTDPVVEVTKCPGGGESWYYAFRRSGKLAGNAHETNREELARLRDLIVRPEKWRSFAKWPKTGDISLGNTENISTGDHSTEEQADAICSLLHRNGFGGNGREFPLKTWVEPVYPGDPPSKY